MIKEKDLLTHNKKKAKGRNVVGINIDGVMANKEKAKAKQSVNKSRTDAGTIMMSTN